jgi:hypothetical protein
MAALPHALVMHSLPGRGALLIGTTHSTLPGYRTSRCLHPAPPAGSRRPVHLFHFSARGPSCGSSSCAATGCRLGPSGEPVRPPLRARLLHLEHHAQQADRRHRNEQEEAVHHRALSFPAPLMSLSPLLHQGLLSGCPTGPRYGKRFVVTDASQPDQAYCVEVE